MRPTTSSPPAGSAGLGKGSTSLTVSRAYDPGNLEGSRIGSWCARQWVLAEMLGAPHAGAPDPPPNVAVLPRRNGQPKVTRVRTKKGVERIEGPIRRRALPAFRTSVRPFVVHKLDGPDSVLAACRGSGRKTSMAVVREKLTPEPTTRISRPIEPGSGA